MQPRIPRIPCVAGVKLPEPRVKPRKATSNFYMEDSTSKQKQLGMIFWYHYYYGIMMGLLLCTMINLVGG